MEAEHEVKRVLRGALVLVALGALIVPAWAATAEVTVIDNEFRSNKVTVSVGDSVKWSRAGSSSGAHNISQANGIFRSGGVTSGSLNYARTFSAGTFNYFCEIHRYDGMKGVVNVPVSIDAAPSGLAFGVRWATGSTNTGTKFDVEYRVGSGSWKAWKKNTSAAHAVFGGARQPSVTAGKTYGFRVRSQKGDGQSEWSPVKTFRV